MRILRVMARVYTAPERLAAPIAFYERLFGDQCKARFPIPSPELAIASVGSIHLIADSEEKLKPFRNAQAASWTGSVADAEKELRSLGCEFLLGPEHGPGGSFMIARHPDGLAVEYIDQAG
jgi:hypothetical protein